MEPLKVERRLEAFRATDAFALESYRTAGAMRGGGGALAEEIRRSAMVCGGALVAASASESGSEAEQRQLRRARTALIESRYYLYLARRFGLLDPRRYRSLTVRQDSALRELDAVLAAGSRPRPP